MLGYSSNQLPALAKSFSGFKINKLTIPSSPATYMQFTEDTAAWFRNAYLNNIRFQEYAQDMAKSIPPNITIYLDRASSNRRNLTNADLFKSALVESFGNMH